MNLKKKYINTISFKFISYNKFSFRSKGFIAKKTQKLLLVFWLLKKYKLTFKLIFKGLKKINKFFTLLSSPKCYKVGKIILKYQLFKYVIILKKTNDKSYNLNNLNLFVAYYTELLKFFDSNYTVNNKINFLLNTNIF